MNRTVLRFIPVSIVLVIALCLLAVVARGEEGATKTSLQDRLYAISDKDQLLSEIEHAHGSLVRLVERSINDLPNRLVDGVLTDTSFQLAKLNWLVYEYQNVTGISYLRNKLERIETWDSEALLSKVRYDSAYSDLLSKLGAVHYRRDTLLLRTVQTGIRAITDSYRSIGDSLAMASTLLTIASIYFDDFGQYDAARYSFEHASRLAMSQQHFSLEGDCYRHLANLTYKSDADYVAAERYAQRAIEKYTLTGSRRMITQVRLDRAARLIATGQDDAAIEVLHRLLSKYREIGILSHAAYCEYALAEAYFSKNMLDSAWFFAELSKHTRVMRFEESGGDEEDVAVSLGCMGKIRQAEGRLAESAYLLASAEEILESGKDDRKLILNQLSVSSLQIKAGFYREAGEVLRNIMERTDEVDLQLYALYGVAVSEYRTGSIDSCRQYLAKCIEMLNNERMRSSIPEVSQAVFSDKVEIFHLMAVTYIEDFEKSGENLFLDTALTFLEMSKARTLRIQFSSGRHDETLTETDLIEEVASVEAKMLIGISNTKVLNDSLQILKDALRTIGIESADTANREDAWQITSHALDEFRSRLSDSGLIADFLISEFGCFRFDITGDSISVARLDISQENARALTKSYSRYLQQYPKEVIVPDSMVEMSKKLANGLFSRVMDNVDGWKKLLVIPSDCLYGFPVGALISNSNDYFVHRFEVSSLPSLAMSEVLDQNDFQQNGLEKVVVFGDPEYTAPNIPRLPHTRKEANVINGIFADVSVTSFLGKSATKSEFLSLDSLGLGILHIAAHGWINERTVGRAGIIFGAEGEEVIEGVLIPREISRLSTSIGLTFLSACESGRGVFVPGEGQMSLVAPFLRAGSRSVISTLWKIDDRASTEIVKTFYQAINDGASAPSALRSAQIQMLSHERRLFRHPYFWASHIYTGNNN